MFPHVATMHLEQMIRLIGLDMLASKTKCVNIQELVNHLNIDCLIMMLIKLKGSRNINVKSRILSAFTVIAKNLPDSCRRLYYRIILDACSTIFKNTFSLARGLARGALNV